jgi:C-terminal processing protease CtpA/Prc
VGVALQKVNGDITITNIAEDGLIGKSDLKVGQKVVSINGNACPSTTKEAIAIIKGTTGKGTITTVGQLVVEGTSEKWVSSISTSKVVTPK